MELSLEDLQAKLEELTRTVVTRLGGSPGGQLPTDPAYSVFPTSQLVRPQVSVNRTANQAIPSATFTAVIWDGNYYNPTVGMHVIGTNPTRLTTPTAGFFLMEATVALAGFAGGSVVALKAVKNNGTATAAAIAQVAQLPSTIANQLGLACCFFLNALDFVEFFVFQDSGGAVNILGAAAPPSQASLAQIL